MEDPPKCHYNPCGRPLPQHQPGQRPRLFCCNSHKTLAHRALHTATQQEQLRKLWRVLPLDAQHHLERIMDLYGVDAARLALDALEASYHDNDNVFQLLRLFRTRRTP